MLRSFEKAGKDVLNAAVGELSKSEKEKSILKLRIIGAGVSLFKILL